VSARLNLHDSAPHSMEEMMSFQEFLGARTLEPRFLELVRAYVSQLNRCAYGIARHTHRARELGESEERLQLLLAWRQTSLYSKSEHAAFAWADSVMRPSAEVGDGDFERACEWFTSEELVDLTFVILVTHAWNRLVIAFGQPPILYRSASST
jgi:AhpD family alkylhydroperoxidase